MIEKPKRKVFKFLTGAIIGGAIGSILGLTLAPKKGEDTRKFIKDKSMELFLSKSEPLPKMTPPKKQGLLKRALLKLLAPKK